MNDERPERKPRPMTRRAMEESDERFRRRYAENENAIRRELAEHDDDLLDMEDDDAAEG